MRSFAICLAFRGQGEPISAYGVLSQQRTNKSHSNLEKHLLEHSIHLKETTKSLKKKQSVKSKPAQYNNVIHEPICDIELSNVCPPYLHILLGIVKKHHDLLEQECHAITGKL